MESQENSSTSRPGRPDTDHSSNGGFMAHFRRFVRGPSDAERGDTDPPVSQLERDMERIEKHNELDMKCEKLRAKNSELVARLGKCHAHIDELIKREQEASAEVTHLERTCRKLDESASAQILDLTQQNDKFQNDCHEAQRAHQAVESENVQLRRQLMMLKSRISTHSKHDEQMADEEIASWADRIFYSIQDFAVGVLKGVQFGKIPADVGDIVRAKRKSDLDRLPPQTRRFLPAYAHIPERVGKSHKTSMVVMVVSAILVEHFQPPLLLGKPICAPLQAAQAFASTLKDLDESEFKQWLLQTRKLLMNADRSTMEKADAAVVDHTVLAIGRAFGGALTVLSNPAHEVKLRKVVSVALELFRALLVAKASFRVFMIPVIRADGNLESFSPVTMSAINSAEDEVSLGGDL
ncbi:Involucrin repeat protein [Teratosphaeria destructans]|uniref:Involucrin repeat protein n=1 Tax=Teratosphaeria destructans TaxID=418781 RepID=A0A9W7SUW0_9PEZI|nr:Involucrin repeat protein [Teratosphaeria destructans]